MGHGDPVLLFLLSKPSGWKSLLFVKRLSCFTTLSCIKPLIRRTKSLLLTIYVSIYQKAKHRSFMLAARSFSQDGF
jgi:hypothetical protein